MGGEGRVQVVAIGVDRAGNPGRERIVLAGGAVGQSGGGVLTVRSRLAAGEGFVLVHAEGEGYRVDFDAEGGVDLLFEGERMCAYEFPFPETDRQLLAVEYWEFGTAIEQGRRPEVDVEQGARSVAMCYAMLESQMAARVVTMEEVLEDRVSAYQEEINAEMGW